MVMWAEQMTNVSEMASAEVKCMYDMRKILL